MTSFFVCPVCGEPLVGEQTLNCENGHCFDRSKYGYVNLLRSNQSGKKRHGDDRAMVLARSGFLDKGYYAPVREAVLRALRAHASEGMRILDAGCGECWYTAYFARELAVFHPAVGGVDISREALREGHKRGGAELAVASTARMPVADGSCDAVLNIFSPEELGEFHRVLRPGGVLIRALPLEGHLWGLKSAVYDTPYANPAPATELPGFTLLSREDVRFSIHLPCQEDIHALFRMTPYCWKTPRAGAERLTALKELDCRISFDIHVFHRKLEK